MRVCVSRLERDGSFPAECWVAVQPSPYRERTKQKKKEKSRSLARLPPRRKRR